MQPTLAGITMDDRGNQLPGDKIIVNKTAYWKNPPQRGDIVVFSTKNINHPNVEPSAVYIKRIVGLPGETISVKPPDILINGNPVKEPEIFSAITESRNGYHGYTFALSGAKIEAILTSPETPITLAEDEYLVLGDNSKTSLDGRHFGPIKKSNILGKVVYRYFPPHKKGVVK